MKKYKYIFGPVPSRRLGISLGIDLVPNKICSMNCVYCEIGKTTNLTLKRDEYVPMNKIIEEIKFYLSESPKLDYITFSGSGEPTLNSRIGEIIKYLKSNYGHYKTALLTNSSLIPIKELRSEIRLVDVILPSLDAASQKIFKKINRPVANLSVNKIIDGLIELRKEFENLIWLEIFVVPGLNDSEDEIIKLRDSIEKIKPDKVQLNSLDRPCSLEWVKKADKDDLNSIAKYFYPIPVEIISNFSSRRISKGYNENVEDDILRILERRPCTINDLSQVMGEKINELNKYLNRLIDQNLISMHHEERGIFFLLNDQVS